MEIRGLRNKNHKIIQTKYFQIKVYENNYKKLFHTSGNWLINSFAKGFSFVRVNGGTPRPIDSLIFGIEILKHDDSDSLDKTDSAVVESNRLDNSSVRLAYTVDLTISFSQEHADVLADLLSSNLTRFVTGVVSTISTPESIEKKLNSEWDWSVSCLLTIA